MACEWQVHICIAEGDLYKAYDKSTFNMVAKSHCLRQVQRVITAAWLREWFRSQSRFKLDADKVTDRVVRFQSLDLYMLVFEICIFGKFKF